MTYSLKLKNMDESTLLSIAQTVRFDVKFDDEMVAKDDKFNTGNTKEEEGGRTCETEEEGRKEGEKEGKEIDGPRDVRDNVSNGVPNESSSPLRSRGKLTSVSNLSEKQVSLEWIRENKKRFAYSLARRYIADYQLPGLGPNTVEFSGEEMCFLIYFQEPRLSFRDGWMGVRVYSRKKWQFSVVKHVFMGNEVEHPILFVFCFPFGIFFCYLVIYSPFLTRNL
jgi:hypothetical protein